MNLQIWEGWTWMGKPVYTNETAQMIRKANCKLVEKGEIIRNIIPQEGFQEAVATCQADIAIVGGKRGGGKTHIMNMLASYHINNPLFTMYGFRREIDDIKKGLWASSKGIYEKIATARISDYSWQFPSGAQIQYEHIADENKVDQRFRGVELPCVVIDEIPQIKVETFFKLLASNRNTINVKNRFVGSCNPVGQRHWVHKMLQWYIDEDTKTIIPERNKKIRYFFKYGKTIEEIVWGNTREEVYRKAKHYIDELWDKKNEASYEYLISSFCFIEGEYSENVIFKLRDPQYKSRLSAEGGQEAIRNINGIWVDDEEVKSELSSEEVLSMFNNTPQTEKGCRYCTCDVALSGDLMVLYAWEGRHLYEFEAFTGVLSDEAIGRCQSFLSKHGIREENFLYDENGLGLFLKGFFKKAKGFNNKQQASDTRLWNNQKSECAEKFAKEVRAGRYSINSKLRNRKVAGGFFEDRLLSEFHALKRKETDNGRFEIISKPEMKKICGHSPDLMEGMIEREGFSENIRRFSNLGMLVNS